MMKNLILNIKVAIWQYFIYKSTFSTLCVYVSGTNYLQQFCAAAVNAVVSPFVLQDIAYESANYLSRNNPNPAQLSAQLRSPTLNSLVQKCLQM